MVMPCKGAQDFDSIICRNNSAMAVEPQHFHVAEQNPDFKDALLVEKLSRESAKEVASHRAGRHHSAEQIGGDHLGQES